MLNYNFMTPLCLFMFWLIGATVVSSSESRFLMRVAKVNEAGTLVAQSPPIKIDPKVREEVKDAVKEVEIIRDHFNLMFCGGGCFAGAVCSIWARKLIGTEALRVFGVILFTGAATSPYLLLRYTKCTPEELVFGGFLYTAVIVWPGWEVAFIISDRVKTAAIKNGWVGVKKELFGATTAQAATSSGMSSIIQAKETGHETNKKPPAA